MIQPNEELQEALVGACIKGKLEDVRALLAQNADPSAPRGDGGTPLYAAAQNGYADVIALLGSLAVSSSVAIAGGFTAMHVAAGRGYVETIRVLARLGANSSAPSESGATPIFMAALNGHTEAVVCLAGLGANLNTPSDSNTMTPAYAAAWHGHANVIRALWDLRADLSVPTSDGSTPFFIAAQSGHVEAVKVLWRLLGRSAITPRKDGVTPMFIAAEYGHANVVRALGSFGVDPDEPVNGATPLFAAADHEREDVILFLAMLGANPSTPRRDGVTPLVIAHRDGNARVIRLLEKLIQEREREEKPLSFSSRAKFAAIERFKGCIKRIQKEFIFVEEPCLADGSLSMAVELIADARYAHRLSIFALLKPPTHFRKVIKRFSSTVAIDAHHSGARVLPTHWMS
jgi:ankyrin repeat protein